MVNDHSTTVGLLKHQARHRGSEAAITLDGIGSLSFQQLVDAAEMDASALTAHGIRAGDRVGIYASAWTSGFEYVSLYFGLQCIGAIPVLMPPDLSQHGVDLVRPLLVIAVPDMGEHLLDVPVVSYADLPRNRPMTYGRHPVVSGGDPAQVVFTSGTTTGQLTPILCHHANLTAPHLTDASPTIEMRSLDRCNPNNIARGAPLIFIEFDPDRYLFAVQKYSISHGLLFGAAAQQIALEAKCSSYDLTSMRLIRVTGSSTAPYVAQSLCDAFPNSRFANIYSATESWPAGTIRLYTRDELATVGDSLTAGWPTPACYLSILDDDGEDLPAGQPGQVCFTIANRIPLRRNLLLPNDNATQTVRPGDIGTLDRHGELSVLCRWKEKIHRGTFDIPIAEIEQVLLEHPAVQAVVVLGVPDRRLGEEIGALVTLNYRIVPEVLSEYCSARLEPNKVPRVIKVIRTIPLSRVGKIDRVAARELLIGAE